MKLIQSLSESQLLSSTTAYKRYTARQLAELVYLHVIAMRILNAEELTKDFAADYAHRTGRYMSFQRWYQNATDLHLLIHGLLSEDVELKMPDASLAFRETLYFDESEIRFWLKDMTNHHVNEARTRKLFAHLDGQFQIKDGSMKAIRRLVQDWPHNTSRQKQLSMTRLLQMMRVRARRSDVLVRLEKLATEMKLELHNVNNPETGDVANHDGSDPAHIKKKPSLLGTVAAVGVGAMLGYHAIKHISEGKVAHRDGDVIIVENPSPRQFLFMKDKADHSEGLRGFVLEGKLFVWDGYHLTHADAARILVALERPMAEMHMWDGYIELDVHDIEQSCGKLDEAELRECRVEALNDKLDAIHGCAALMKIYENRPLVHFDSGNNYFDDMGSYLAEDGDAGVSCSADIAPMVQVMGTVQRRRKKRKKKTK